MLKLNQKHNIQVQKKLKIHFTNFDCTLVPEKILGTTVQSKIIKLIFENEAYKKLNNLVQTL